MTSPKAQIQAPRRPLTVILSILRSSPRLFFIISRKQFLRLCRSLGYPHQKFYSLDLLIRKQSAGKY